MRVPGARGPTSLCSFAERDEIARSPGSISSPTFGWEKQNYSNGVSRLEGAKGWMRVGDRVPSMPCHSWSIHCALSTLGTWIELPCQVLRHASGHVMFPLCLTLPPCRASIQPLHHLHGLPEIHREHRRLQVTLWDGGCKGPKNGMLWEEGDSATFWELLVP